RRSRLWFGLVAVSMAFLGFSSVVLLLEGSNSSVDQLASRLRRVTRELRQNLGGRFAEGSTPAGPAANGAGVPLGSSPPLALPAINTEPAVADTGARDAGTTTDAGVADATPLP